MSFLLLARLHVTWNTPSLSVRPFFTFSITPQQLLVLSSAYLLLNSILLEAYSQLLWTSAPEQKRCDDTYASLSFISELVEKPS